MFSNLTSHTKLKLIIPFIYFIISLVYFWLSWPSNASMNHYAGVVLTTASFILWVTARIQLGDSFSISPKAKKLVTSGIYSKLRHPVYYFSIGALTGLCIFSLNPALLLTLLALIVLELIRRSKEEQKLTEAFGDKYRDYRKSTWF